jgi:hypothetical protein
MVHNFAGVADTSNASFAGVNDIGNACISGVVDTSNTPSEQLTNLPEPLKGQWRGQG